MILPIDFRKMPEDFDISKASEVEGMSDADFSVWRSAKHSEVCRKNT